MTDGYMRCAIRLDDPGKADCTMTITLSLNDWQLLEKQIREGTNTGRWMERPASELVGFIKQLTEKITKHFKAEEKADLTENCPR